MLLSFSVAILWNTRESHVEKRFTVSWKTREMHIAACSFEIRVKRVVKCEAHASWVGRMSMTETVALDCRPFCLTFTPHARPSYWTAIGIEAKCRPLLLARSLKTGLVAWDPTHWHDYLERGLLVRWSFGAKSAINSAANRGCFFHFKKINLGNATIKIHILKWGNRTWQTELGDYRLIKLWSANRKLPPKVFWTTWRCSHLTRWRTT